MSRETSSYKTHSYLGASAQSVQLHLFPLLIVQHMQVAIAIGPTPAKML